MSVNTWTPLWSPIVDSSLWEENGEVVKVFMTMIATKDSSHICNLDAYKVAKKCNFRLPDGSVDEVKVLDILKILSSPDKRRKIKQEYDGRRIKAVEGGWLILNGEKYRQMVSDEMRKARLRRAQDTYRKKQKYGSNHLAGEGIGARMYDEGNEAAGDNIAAERKQ
jgi:hypothetical protein